MSYAPLVRLTRYVVIELKTGKFQPEYAGKLNFYVAFVDDVLRRDHHNEAIGILICGTKNDHSVRYSLGSSTSPMAVAAYTYDKLPPAEQEALPNEGHLVAAQEWAEPAADAKAGLLVDFFLKPRLQMRNEKFSQRAKDPLEIVKVVRAISPTLTWKSCAAGWPRTSTSCTTC